MDLGAQATIMSVSKAFPGLPRRPGATIYGYGLGPRENHHLPGTSSSCPYKWWTLRTRSEIAEKLIILKEVQVVRSYPSGFKKPRIENYRPKNE